MSLLKQRFAMGVVLQAAITLEQDDGEGVWALLGGGWILIGSGLQGPVQAVIAALAGAGR